MISVVTAMPQVPPPAQQPDPRPEYRIGVLDDLLREAPGWERSIESSQMIRTPGRQDEMQRNWHSVWRSAEDRDSPDLLAYHGTDFAGALSCIIAGVRPGPNQLASGKTERMAFAADAFHVALCYSPPFQLGAAYDGPDGPTFLTIVLGVRSPENGGGGWRASNRNYRIATRWEVVVVYYRWESWSTNSRRKGQVYVSETAVGHFGPDLAHHVAPAHVPSLMSPWHDGAFEAVLEAARATAFARGNGPRSGEGAPLRFRALVAGLRSRLTP